MKNKLQIIHCEQRHHWNLASTAMLLVSQFNRQRNYTNNLRSVSIWLKATHYQVDKNSEAKWR